MLRFLHCEVHVQLFCESWRSSTCISTNVLEKSQASSVTGCAQYGGDVRSAADGPAETGKDRTLDVCIKTAVIQHNVQKASVVSISLDLLLLNFCSLASCCSLGYKHRCKPLQF